MQLLLKRTAQSLDTCPGRSRMFALDCWSEEGVFSVLSLGNKDILLIYPKEIGRSIKYTRWRTYVTACDTFSFALIIRLNQFSCHKFRGLRCPQKYIPHENFCLRYTVLISIIIYIYIYIDSTHQYNFIYIYTVLISMHPVLIQYIVIIILLISHGLVGMMH